LHKFEIHSHRWIQDFVDRKRPGRLKFSSEDIEIKISRGGEEEEVSLDQLNRGPVEHCKLPQQCPGRSISRK